MRRSHSETYRVISAHGSHAWVSPLTGPLISQVVPLKGRALKPVAGDIALVSRNSESLVELLPRRNALVRAESHRQKVIAANLDLIIILISGEPLFSPELLVRLMATLFSQGLPCIIALNKTDLAKESDRARASLCSCLPWPCLADAEISCKTHELQSPGSPAGLGLESLLKAIQARGIQNPVVGLIGQSGMGKSSLLNALIPNAGAQTQAISQTLQSGRQTTTVSRSYEWLNVGGWLIDTPGFQTFGIQHLTTQDLLSVFPEWHDLQRNGRCRFYNCQHDREPGCVLAESLEAMRSKALLNEERYQQLQQRLDLWRRLARELR
ncbi:MAG: ribosome small subunit-dependent GTPase A [Bordetella sp.]